MSAVDVTASVELDPVDLARLFWQMDAEQQADFFAALDAEAGLALCMQMAAVVHEITKRSDRGDRWAMNGFRTMLSHADAYFESATDIRVWDAQRHIAGMAA